MSSIFCIYYRRGERTFRFLFLGRQPTLMARLRGALPYGLSPQPFTRDLPPSLQIKTSLPHKILTNPENAVPPADILIRSGRARKFDENSYLLCQRELTHVSGLKTNIRRFEKNEHFRASARRGLWDGDRGALFHILRKRA